jgi:hypothetical protein
MSTKQNEEKLRCPKCGREDGIKVEVPTWTEYDEDGDPVHCCGMSDTASSRCSCGHRGAYVDFKLVKGDRR